MRRALGAVKSIRMSDQIATSTANTSHRSDSTWQRRARSIPAVVLGLLVMVPLMVVLVPLLTVYDLVRYRRLPTVRLALFGMCYLAGEVFAVVASAVLWILAGLGTQIHRGWSQRQHSQLQAFWVRALLGAADRLLGLRFDVAGAEVLDASLGRPLIVLCRHTSLIDTLIPAYLLMSKGYRLRYVLKHELMWDPALDIIGHRLPNHFVDRSGNNTSGEIAALRSLAAAAGPGEAVVIFPEGTRWTESKRSRVQEKLESSDPALAAEIAGRVFTMPPRPGGTLALLDGAPAAEVVTLTYTGLEGLAGPKEALTAAPLQRPVSIEIWATDRAEIPSDTSGQTQWLIDEWGRVDDWITAHRHQP